MRFFIILAGLSYTLKPTKTGFELTARGYNEKMPQFLYTIVEAIYKLDLSEVGRSLWYFTDLFMQRKPKEYPTYTNLLQKTTNTSKTSKIYRHQANKS